MRKAMVAAVAAAMVAGGVAMAQQPPPVPDKCRQEIRALCRGITDRLGQCVRKALPKMSDECRKAVNARAMTSAGKPEGMREHSYGADPKQRLDLLNPIGNARAPLLFYVHGGGWSIGDKAAGATTKGLWATGRGWAYVSANYRLVPQATVEQQVADLASALAWLRADARRLNLDPNRIVLMGHSAGAHLVALLATDPRYLQVAGVPLSAVRGVVLLDGAGYDVARQMAEPRNLVGGMYEAAFGRDPARQAALSPTLNAALPNAGQWLILPVQSRADSQDQSRRLAEALTRAGTAARVVAVPGESHRSLNVGLGEIGDFATTEIERFLAGLGFTKGVGN